MNPPFNFYYNILLYFSFNNKKEYEISLIPYIIKINSSLISFPSLYIYCHIHYMIDTEPNINLSNLVRMMKSYITYNIWKNNKNYLSKQFWKEKTFFSDGYFITSIGNVSHETLKRYIENQGK